MNPEERTEVGKMWLLAAKTLRGIELERDSIKMLINSVEDLPFERVKAFFISWMKTSKLGRHPYPAEVREAIELKPADNKFLAMEATTRILEAIKKFGEFDSAEARKFIGDLGWKGVQKYGWPNLCANLGVAIQVTTFTAQMRETLTAILELRDSGIIDEPIMLERKKSTGLVQAGRINYIDLVPPKPEGK